MFGGYRCCIGLRNMPMKYHGLLTLIISQLLLLCNLL